MTKKTSSRSKPSPTALLGLRLGTATTMFHTAVADELGVGLTDARCCAVLAHAGPLTAGGLAERLGITTGAVTGLIDRLERARLARRIPDESDRRRVVVELVPDLVRERHRLQLVAPMGKRIEALLAARTVRERETISRFLTEACEVLEDETRQILARSPSSRRR